jgi:membrane associated rhomboid family serine protease
MASSEQTEYAPGRKDFRVDILPQLDGEEGSAGKGKVWEWSLVLSAMRIRHTVRRAPQGWQILVPVEQRDEALREITLYEEENRQGAAEEFDTVRGSTEPSVWMLVLLGAFYKLTTMRVSAFGYPDVPWKELGSANAWAVAHGEWWRLVTALTLHGNLQHLLGNMVVGGIFIVPLCRLLGSGAGWFLVIAAGLLGNGVNIALQGHPHDSLGFSTSVFAAVGILGGMRTLERTRVAATQKFLPLAAGLGLLSLLGFGGKQTDIGAHVFGFLAGFLLGTAFGAGRNLGLGPGQRVNSLLGVSALLLVAAAWLAALTLGQLPRNI